LNFYAKLAKEWHDYFDNQLIIKDNDTIFLKTCQFFIEFPSIGGEYQQVPLNV
jgi:hypothetical protein